LPAASFEGLVSIERSTLNVWFPPDTSLQRCIRVARKRQVASKLQFPAARTAESLCKGKARSRIEEQGRKEQEQEATIAQLKATVTQQQKGMEVLAASLKEQAAQIQKVSTELEVSKAAPQMVLNNQ
jgi:uncharacterized coiled-coil protein SlyX